MALETDISIPHGLKNEWHTEIEGTKIAYVARATNLALSNGYIRGVASLEKYVQVPTKRIKIGLRPFSIQRQPGTKWRNIWTFSKGNTEDRWDRTYFVGSRGDCYDRDSDLNYGGAIIEEAVRQGLILSDEILINTFGPITKKLNSLYRTIMEYEKQRN